MNVVGVRFRRAGEVRYFDPGTLGLELDDRVVVNSAKGIELGWVVIAPKQVIFSELEGPLEPVLRKATEEDIRKKALST